MYSGANIATKAGEGDAFIYNWHELHQNINNLLQKEAQHQQAIRDNYTKSALVAAEAIKTLRPADIEDFKNTYNNFKDADLMLTNPKIQKDNKAFQYYTDKKMSALADLNQIQANSKNTAQNLLNIQTENVKSGGVNSKPDFYDKLNFLNNIPSKQILEKGLLSPTNYFFDKSPIDFNKVNNTILGGIGKTPNISVPTADKKMINNYTYEVPKNAGLIMKNGVPEMSEITGKPKLDYSGIIQTTADIYKSAGSNTKLLYDINNQYKQDVQTNPRLVQETFQKAKQLLDESGQDGSQLSMSPEYYLLAKNIVAANNMTKGYITKEIPSYQTKMSDSLDLYKQKKQISFNYNEAVKNNDFIRAGELLRRINQLNINNSSDISVNGKTYKDIPVEDKNVYSRFSVVAKIPKGTGLVKTMSEGRREPNKFLFDPSTGNYVALFYKYDPETMELTDDIDNNLTKIIPPESFNLAQMGATSLLRKGGADVIENASKTHIKPNAKSFNKTKIE